MGFSTTARGVAYPDTAEPVAPLEDVFQTVAVSVDDALGDVSAEIAAAVADINDPPRCHAYRSTAATLTTYTWSSALSLQQTVYDLGAPSAQHAGTLERIYFRVDGLYSVKWRATLNPMTGGGLWGMVRENAGGVVSGGVGIQDAHTVTIATDTNPYVGGEFDRTFSAGDYIEMFLRQNAGGDVNIIAGGYDTFMQTRWVAAT